MATTAARKTPVAKSPALTLSRSPASSDSTSGGAPPSYQLMNQGSVVSQTIEIILEDPNDRHLVDGTVRAVLKIWPQQAHEPGYKADPPSARIDIFHGYSDKPIMDSGDDLIPLTKLQYIAEALRQAVARATEAGFIPSQDGGK